MQQTDKHGPARDEALKLETQRMVRSANAIDVEEWDEPEPSADDQLNIAAHPGGGSGGAPAGMTPREVEERSLLARHLGPEIYPATRDALVAKLRELHAPERFVHRIEGLPGERAFQNVREVAESLGMHVEAHRS